MLMEDEQLRFRAETESHFPGDPVEVNVTFDRPLPEWTRAVASFSGPHTFEREHRTHFDTNPDLGGCRERLCRLTGDITRKAEPGIYECTALEIYYAPPWADPERVVTLDVTHFHHGILVERPTAPKPRDLPNATNVS
jgi:hypothetical protein